MDKELHTPKMDIGFWKSCDEMDFCQLFVNIISSVITFFSKMWGNSV